MTQKDRVQQICVHRKTSWLSQVAEVHNQHLRPASHPIDFQIWLDVAGSGHAFRPVVPKMASSQDGSRHINVGNVEVGLGSLLQVHIRDGIVSQIELEHQFQVSPGHQRQQHLSPLGELQQCGFWCKMRTELSRFSDITFFLVPCLLYLVACRRSLFVLRS